MTIAPPSSFPSPIAMSVAGTRITRYRASSSGCSNVASFTSTSPLVRTLGATGAQNLSCMATADHVCETSGGAWSGASPTTTVPSVFIPRIAPPYTPNSITWRPSSVAPRAITCAASCTPWPPMPVIRSSRSTQSSQHEQLQVLDVLARGSPAGDERVVHAPDHQVVHGVGVALRIATDIGHGLPQRTHQELARACDFVGEAVGKPRAVDRERPRVLRRGRVARLFHHALDPRSYARLACRSTGHAVLEVGDELSLAVVEDRDQQLVLAAEVAV